MCRFFRKTSIFVVIFKLCEYYLYDFSGYTKRDFAKQGARWRVVTSIVMYFYDKTLFVCLFLWLSGSSFPDTNNLYGEYTFDTTCIRVEILNIDIHFNIIILFCIHILVLNVIFLYIDIILQSVLSTGRNIFSAYLLLLKCVLLIVDNGLL